jgi:O-antigen/teichoic acid export membrane protein
MPSMIWDNKITRNSLLNFTAFIVPILTTIIFTPFLLHKMGSYGYGLWAISLSFLGLTGVFELGLGTALSKYLAQYLQEDSIRDVSAVASMGLVITLVIAFGMFVPMFLLAPTIARLFASKELAPSTVEAAIRYSSIGFIPSLIKSVSLGVPIGFQDYMPSSFIRVVQNLTISVAAFVVASMGAPPESVILSSVGVVWLAGVASLIFAITRMRKHRAAFVWSMQQAKELGHYMLYSGGTQVGITLFSSMDRVLVGIVLGVSDAAYYTIAIGIAKKLIGFASAITHSLMPASSAWVSEGEIAKTRRYLWHSTFILLGINILLVPLLAAFAHPLLVFWLGRESAEMLISPFRILILIYGVMSVSAPSFHVANGIDKPWINSLGTLLQGGGVMALIIILGRRYGIEGAAWANITSWVKFVSLPYASRTLTLRVSEHADAQGSYGGQ